SSTWLVVVLFLWLVLSIARQVFDLIGRLWIPVAFNLLQMLSCITGLFAICQQRVCLLIALTVSSILSIVYNVLIVLWYNGIFGDITMPILSAGLPYSYSFFLRHTPFCQSHFNLTTSLWVQSPCIIPFRYIESTQAIVHAMLAVITVSLSLVVLRECKGQRRYSERKGMKQPKITVEFVGGENIATRLKKSNTSNIANNLSNNSCMNSSYEASVEALGDAIVARPQNGYIRQSARRPRAKAPRPPSCASAIYQRSGESDDYSAATTVEIGKSSNGRSSRSSCRDVSNRRTRSGYLDEDWSDYEDPYARPKARTGSIKSFKLAATEGVRRILSHEQVASSSGVGDRSSAQHFSGNNLTSLVSFDPKSNTLIRVREHVDDETDDDFYEISSSVPQRNALNSQDCVPTTQAPGIDLMRVQYAPHLSHTSAEQRRNYANVESMRNPAHAGYSIVDERLLESKDRLPSPPSKTVPHIGYEPALCDPLPTASCNPARAAGIPLIYEPVYRSTPQKSSGRKNAVGHYHDPNALRLMAYENEPRGAPSALPIINDNSLLV
uniref:Sodium/potassium-transporting ATPase subunit beta-1-interacting protein n=1 Tax=Parascaris univalens TaxID=6257 RepID=A0A915B4X3_PARUN